ncbi:hypothetical protein WA158_004814 [Blastocystis sp. Blastoise]
MRFYCWILFFICVTFGQIARPKLHVDENGSFRVAQFTDLHFEGNDKDPLTVEVMKKLIGYAHPDFIALSGDAIGGYAWDKKTPNWFYNEWTKCTSAMNDTKTFYGYTLGNHDAEGDLSREEIMRLDMTHPYSMSEVSPEGVVGGSNFVVPVYAHNDDTKVVLTLWFLDSNDYNCSNVYGYGCIDTTAIEWYIKKSKEFEQKEGYVVPGLAFFHIATPEYLTAWAHFNGTGYKKEHSGCSSVNSGFIAAALQRKDIKGTYVGHDHAIDFEIDYYGIHLSHGRKTGVAGYGPSENVKRGSRIIDVTVTGTNDMKLDSWILNEDGEKEVRTELMGDVTIHQDICNRSKTPRLY